MTAPTEKELEILRHSTDWPKTYRNYFVTGEGSDDYPVCESLVSKGLMRRRQCSLIPEGCVYTVTVEGQIALEEAFGGK